MMLKNNRGFVATAVLYSLVLLISIILFLSLRTLATARKTERDNAQQIKNQLTYYDITFDGNGGTVNNTLQKKIYGRDFIITEEAIRSGYAFLGWGTDPNGKVIYKKNDIYKKNEALNLYAIWGAIEYSKTFSYTGAIQSLEIPYTGVYKLEVWGASGGTRTANHSNGSSTTTSGGLGGYTTGQKSLEAGTIIYIGVGGVGGNGTNHDHHWKNSPGGFNGGGSSGLANGNDGGGGGGGGYYGGQCGISSSYNNDTTASTGGSGYIGGVVGGSMRSGIQSGNGYAKITWIG